MTHRAADRKLARGAWRLARSRKGSIMMTLAALAIAATFGIRQLFEPSDYDGRGFEFYGNHCGPEHGTGGDAIDELDELCKTHDQDYRRLR